MAYTPLRGVLKTDMRHPADHRLTHARAFSLVELSIVLVILGLLVGGVLAGQSLIRASELRTITAQHEQFVTAVQSFRDKYFTLPGDMSNATQFWGARDSNPATCTVTAISGTLTCNGNGDTLLNGAELGLFWQHLYNAGLMPSSDWPMSKLPMTSVWNAMSMADLNMAPGSNGNMFNGSYGNVLLLGADDPAIYMTPTELWNIDTKIDDGKPATGKLVATGDSLGVTGDGIESCTNTNDGSNLAAVYRLDRDQNACGLIFRQQF